MIYASTYVYVCRSNQNSIMYKISKFDLFETHNFLLSLFKWFVRVANKTHYNTYKLHTYMVCACVDLFFDLKVITLHYLRI